MVKLGTLYKALTRYHSRKETRSMTSWDDHQLRTLKSGSINHCICQLSLRNLQAIHRLLSVDFLVRL